MSYDFSENDLEMIALRMLFEQFAYIAGLQYAYDLGNHSVRLRAQKLDGTYTWQPGEYIPANEQRVDCCWCGSSYRLICGDLQGDDCAASVYREDNRWFVQGHYGSGRHDMNIYLVNKHEDLFESRDNPGKGLDPICDRCIDTLIQNGTLTLHEEHVL